MVIKQIDFAKNDKALTIYITFPKINYENRHQKKLNEPELEINIYGWKNPKNGRNKYREFGVIGSIYTPNKKDIEVGGQCLEEMEKYLKNNPVFKLIAEYWRNKHLKELTYDETVEFLDNLKNVITKANEIEKQKLKKSKSKKIKKEWKEKGPYHEAIEFLEEAAYEIPCEENEGQRFSL